MVVSSHFYRCSQRLAEVSAPSLCVRASEMAKEMKRLGDQCTVQLPCDHRSLFTIFPSELEFRDGVDEECGTLAGSGRAGGMIYWG